MEHAQGSGEVDAAAEAVAGLSIEQRPDSGGMCAAEQRMLAPPAAVCSVQAYNTLVMPAEAAQRRTGSVRWFNASKGEW
jgi:hypothetical protein